ncbi:MULTISPECIES: PTS sugar transporter subunit IIBC [Pedobacter]|uniref:PTS sugar transporter subunit IIBC n=1 Tax=Pedobacter roseus TaxID=336820 RepID=A0A7G9QH04_9SPHI|nr:MULTISPECIES: PTS sugar transporter subunit IIBC [Pedobacter]QNN42629.1 PTS sugar transporter subunit IIBC [Pedobacter roseus]
MNFTERKISVKRAIVVLAKNGIYVDDSEAGIILDFLYLISKNYSGNQDGRTYNIPKETSNKSKSASKSSNDVF